MDNKEIEEEFNKIPDEIIYPFGEPIILNWKKLLFYFGEFIIKIGKLIQPSYFRCRRCAYKEVKKINTPCIKCGLDQMIYRG